MTLLKQCNLHGINNSSLLSNLLCCCATVICRNRQPENQNFIQKVFSVKIFSYLLAYSLLLFSLSTYANSNEKKAKEIKKYPFSSTVMLDRFADFLANVKSASLSEFTREKLEKAFQVPMEDVVMEDGSIISDIISNYGNTGLTADNARFLIEVSNEKKRKVFNLTFQPIQKNNEFYCTIDTDRFTQKMAAINFVEQKEFGSVIQPEFNPSNNIIRGEWVDSIFRHRTKNILFILGRNWTRFDNPNYPPCLDDIELFIKLEN